jgi:hypothetical protein
VQFINHGHPSSLKSFFDIELRPFNITKGQLSLQAFCDSGWADNHDDRQSITGLITIGFARASLPSPPTLWCDNFDTLTIASNPVKSTKTSQIAVLPDINLTNYHPQTLGSFCRQPTTILTILDFLIQLIIR